MRIKPLLSYSYRVIEILLILSVTVGILSIGLSSHDNAEMGGLDKILKVVDDDLEALKAEKIRSAMGELGNAISFAYIAKHYFGKSQSWLTQRLNGSKVNGKTARFNKSELIQFQNAIHDLGRKLSAIAFL